MSSIDPFDTPNRIGLDGFTGATLENVRVVDSQPSDTEVVRERIASATGPLGNAVENVRERLQEDVRARAKSLEIALATAKADLENARLDLQTYIRNSTPCQSCGADPCVSPKTGEELPVVAGALDAQAAAEQRVHAANERAKSLERELVNLRQLQEHTVAAGALNRAALARAIQNIEEIGKLLDVGPEEDGAQIRRAIGLLVSRSNVLDQVLDEMIDGMTRPAKTLLSDPQPNFAKHSRATGELQTSGALVPDDEGRWNWTTIGELLRARRAEHLGSKRSTGEYKAT